MRVFKPEPLQFRVKDESSLCFSSPSLADAAFKVKSLVANLGIKALEKKYECPMGYILAQRIVAQTFDKEGWSTGVVPRCQISVYRTAPKSATWGTPPILVREFAFPLPHYL
jgi:hypothetical protein